MTADRLPPTREEGSCQPARLELVAVLGHELRSPLGALRNALQVLEAEPSDPALRRRMLAILGRQVRHLSSLVDNLLDTSTRGVTDLAIHRERLDLAALVEGLVESQRPVFEAAELRLVAELPPPVLVDGDAIRLSQVIDNLLANALKFTPPGGEVRVALQPADGEVRLTVADTGDGIAQGDLDAVFEPFRRGTGRRAACGLGLGLAIVRRLVEAHGGSVEARSDGPGRGTELLVRLPLAERHEPGPRLVEA